jgi:hypothetical protein
VKSGAAAADQERDLTGPLAGTEGEVAGLLHGPPTGRAGSDVAEVHPAGAMLCCPSFVVSV